MTPLEKRTAGPVAFLLFGWSCLIVCALLALDTAGLAWRWFVGPHYLLSYAWALVVYGAARLIWRRRWRLFQRLQRRVPPPTRLQRLFFWGFLSVVLVHLAGFSIPSKRLLDLGETLFPALLLLLSVLTFMDARAARRRADQQP